MSSKRTVQAYDHLRDHCSQFPGCGMELRDIVTNIAAVAEEKEPPLAPIKEGGGGVHLAEGVNYFPARAPPR